MSRSFGKTVEVGDWLRQAGCRLADLVLPRVCAACGEAVGIGRGELCTACWQELSRSVGGTYCRSCGQDRIAYLLSDGQCTDCRLRKTRLRLDGFARVGRYDGALKQLVLSFKHQFVLDKLLGRLLSQAILGRFDPAAVDLWVPIPAHWRRRFAVGFQPTALLARATTVILGGRIEPVLIAKRYVPPFHLREKLSVSDRMDAIKGAFAVTRQCRLDGRTVCMIDDVSTTGATLAEARRVLQAAGAGRIMAAVVAKASGRPPPLAGLDRPNESVYTAVR